MNLDLRRLGGGGAGDPWALPSDLYSQLRAKYMELAGARKCSWAATAVPPMSTGRKRLGDFNSAAAGALVAGKHWRRRRVLYRDRLNRLDAAAGCLEKGGLWAEAIELYEQMANFEKMGDLVHPNRSAGRGPKGMAAGGRKTPGAGDSIGAAEMLETSLQDPNEALEVLAAAWPAFSQAGRCLAAEFALLGRLGRHEAAQLPRGRDSPPAVG